MYQYFYYAQDPSSLRWEGAQHFLTTPLSFDEDKYKPFYVMIPILNYMGEQWHTSTHLLHYLLSNKSVRRLLLRQRIGAHEYETRPAQLYHPLLTTPLDLNWYDTDRELYHQIKRRLEEVTMWTN